MAEGLCGAGQQERAHPVGGDDARGGLRCGACQRQARGQAQARQPDCQQLDGSDIARSTGAEHLRLELPLEHRQTIIINASKLGP